MALYHCSPGYQREDVRHISASRTAKKRGFTAAEFKAAQAEGWEKQYPYKVGKKKVYMAPSAAQEQGYVRMDKHPKSTRYGRQNPISARWNSEEQLVVWREAWATAANRCLELAGQDSRIDHRSHAERGLEERPTIHEGVAAQALERRGIISDRCELNRQIKADNALLRELKAEIKKLAALVAHTVPAVAERLEKLRSKILIFCYQLSHIRAGRTSCQKALTVYKPQLTRFTNLAQQIKEKSRERKTVKAEKKALPAWQVFKHKELATKIAELTEDLEELRSEKALLLQQFEYAEDAGAETFRKDIAVLESNLQKFDEQEQKYSIELDATLHEYAEAKAQAAGLDPVELYEARQAIRPGQETAANEKLEQVFGEKYSPLRWVDAKQAQMRLTNDSAENMQPASWQSKIKNPCHSPAANESLNRSGNVNGGVAFTLTTPPLRFVYLLSFRVWMASLPFTAAKHQQPLQYPARTPPTGRSTERAGCCRRWRGLFFRVFVSPSAGADSVLPQVPSAIASPISGCSSVPRSGSGASGGMLSAALR